MSDDLISRTAAIETVRKAQSIGQAHRMLVQLPPAQLAQDLPKGCTDTISRAAVVDVIEGVDWYHQNKNGEMVHGANPDEHQAWYKADDIYAAIDSAPSAQPVEDVRAMCGECDAWNQYKNPQTGWIPVAERLPENDNDVLVTDGTDCAVAYWRTDAQAWDDSMHGWCDLYGLEVTAWMPLPTPYREGRQDDH